MMIGHQSRELITSTDESQIIWKTERKGPDLATGRGYFGNSDAQNPKKGTGSLGRLLGRLLRFWVHDRRGFVVVFTRGYYVTGPRSIPVLRRLKVVPEFG